jgi:hypothetical protein
MANTSMILQIARGRPFTDVPRFFSSSAACLKAKPKATNVPMSRPDVPSPPPTVAKAIKLPTGIKEWEVLSYVNFMKKLQKLNPEVQLTRSLADGALEKSARAGMPKVVWNVVQDVLCGGQKLRGNGGSNARQLAQNWKRLQAESAAYWAENTHG